MLRELEKEVARYIEATGLFGSAHRVLLAVSGGADSVALVHVMHRLRTEGTLEAELLCGHVNHQLRGREADLDEQFVIETARKLGLPIAVRRVDVRGYARAHKMSIETAARQLRIESLMDIARANGCRWVATGHQKNDNAETVVQRLSRGTGFRGLAGIRPMHVFGGELSFVRPLLCATREELVAYLHQENIEWREDRTNTDCSYRRNYIRHRLLPYLQQQCGGSVVEQLSQLAQSANRLNEQVRDSVERVWAKIGECTDGRAAIESAGLRSQGDLVKVGLVQKAMAGIGCGEKDMTRKHYDRILRLVEDNSVRKNLELPGGFTVRVERGEIVFCRCAASADQAFAVGEGVTLAIPGSTRFAGYRIDAAVTDVRNNSSEDVVGGRESEGVWKSTERFDLDMVAGPVSVRRRAVGDRFQPLGMAGEKRIGKFLTSVKAPQAVRGSILIVKDTEKIIWVYPIRISEKVKVTDKTRRVLRLKVSHAASS